MSTFGASSRQSTQTGTAGIAAPTVKKTAATAVQRDVKVPDAMDALVEQNALGTALKGFMDGERDEREANDRRRGAAEVANNKALTEVQKASENTGWEKFLFGKDATHQGMQEQIVSNRLRGNYNTELAEISQSANMTPDKYYEALQDKNAKILEEYKDDPSTRRLIQEQLTAETAKLIGVQTKEHYGWKQETGKKLYQDKVQKLFDGYSLEKMHAITETEKRNLREEILGTLVGGQRPFGMDDEAQRISMMEVVMANSREGNAGALLAAQAAGLDKNLPLGMQVKWDASVRAYDTQFFNQIDTINTNALIQIESAVFPEQIRAAANQQLEDLEEVMKRSSGSDYAIKQLTKGILGREQNWTKAKAMQAKLDKERAKIKKTADEAEADALAQLEKDEDLSTYHATTEGGIREELQRKHNFTKKELGQSFDTHLIKESATFFPKMPTIAEFGTELKKNPQLAQHVLNKLNQSKIESPLVKNILQTTSEATDTFYDEDGKPSEDGINAVAMMNTLAQTDKFQNMMGSKHLARKWHIRQKGIKAGEGQGATDKYIASWETNLGNADAAGFSWKQLYMGDVTSRRDWMKGMLQGQDIRNPTPTQISHALADYKDSMIAFSNQDDATHFFQQTLKANKRLVKGHIIDDAPWLDDLKWEATDLLNTMGNDENLMQGVLDVLNLKEKDGSFIKSIDRITNPRIYTQEGVKGLFISSPTSAREAFISIEQLREAESIVSVKKELAAKIARQRKADALILSVRHDTDMATFKGK